MFSKKFFVTLAVLGLIGVMAYGMIGSGAWFTDGATSNPSTLYSGTLSINDTALSTATVTVPNMAPGDKTQDVVILITNNGSIPLIWFGNLQVNGSDLLKEAIYIDYALMQFEGGNWAEADDNFIKDGVGDGLYPGAYDNMAADGLFEKISLAVFDGTNAMGTTPYEFVGALKPGYAYRLTLRFGFAEKAGNEYQAKGPLTITFKADATQVTEGAINALHPTLEAGPLYWVNWANGQIANQN